jgi:hypothetical protein
MQMRPLAVVGRTMRERSVHVVGMAMVKSLAMTLAMRVWVGADRPAPLAQLCASVMSMKALRVVILM